MGTQLEQNIEEMFKKAMKELRDIIQYKVTLINSANSSSWRRAGASKGNE
jgi:hypothetical protein